MSRSVQNLTNIFQYFRGLNVNCRTLCTMDFDMINDLKISRIQAENLYDDYELHYTKEKSFAYDQNYLRDFIMDFEIEDENYTKYLINNNQNNIYKFIYSIDFPNFIYFWIETYKEYMPQNILRKLQTIINTKYNDNNKVNEYIKKKYLQSALMEFGSETFMKFYDYCRLQYLLQQTMQFNFVPSFYDSSTGHLYFSTKNKIKNDKVAEKYQSNNNLKINFYPTLILNEDNILNYYRDIKTKKWDTTVKMDINTPNFVRYIMKYILTKNQKLNSLDEAKIEGYKKCIMLEDFCKKSNDGLTMDLPLNNKWQTITAQELRKSSKNYADINEIYNKYDVLLNNTVQAVWA